MFFFLKLQVHKLYSLHHSKQTHLVAFEIALKEIGLSGFADIGDIEELSQIQSLWNELLVINNCLSARPEEIIIAPIQMLELEAHICQSIFQRLSS